MVDHDTQITPLAAAAATVFALLAARVQPEFDVNRNIRYLIQPPLWASRSLPFSIVIVIFGENISTITTSPPYPSIAYSAADSADAGEIYQTNFPSNATAPPTITSSPPSIQHLGAPGKPHVLTDNPNGPTAPARPTTAPMR